MARLGNVLRFLTRRKKNEEKGKDTPGKAPYMLPFRSSTILIVVTVNLAIFADIFFYGLIVPVLPFALSIQVGVPEDQTQYWISILLAAYSAALFVGSPIAGIYADHTESRRWPLLLGLIALAGSTFLLAFGNSIGLFLLGRILQGLSAAVVWSVGCALLVDTMGSNVGVAMGYITISMNIALILAPVIGGVVYNKAGYYAVYYVAFGVVGLDIALRLTMIEKKIAKKWIAEPAAVTETETSQRDVEKTLPAAAEGDKALEQSTGVTGAGPLAADSAVEASHSDEEGPAPKDEPKKQKGRGAIELLKSPRLLTALYGILVESGILLGFDAVLALFVRDLFDWDSSAVAVLFLALFIPGFIAPLAGWLSDKYGAKWPSFAGFVLVIPILVSLRFVTDNTIQHKVLLAFLLAIAGFALPFALTPLLAEISYVIEAKEAETPGIFGEKGVYGLAYGLFNMSFALGGIIGPIWAGYVIDGAGWGTLTWNFALWAASAAVVIFIWGANTPKPSVEEETHTEST
ncbi:MFS transporter-like protein [Astrocystis sublimbata]|nr:MFS transporter-like protein [Astrocystis sublimbata]